MKIRKQLIGKPPGFDGEFRTRAQAASRRIKDLERAGTNLYNTLTIIEVDGYKHEPQPINPTAKGQQVPPIPTTTTLFLIYPVDSSDPFSTQEMWTET